MSKSDRNTADIAEAQKCISKAEKNLKTSLFQWKPHYLEGAEEYQKAAELFARSSARPEACSAWRKASEAFQKANCDVEAANCLEKMASFLTGKYESSLPSPSPGEVSETLREVLAAFEEASLLLRAERSSRSIDILHRLVDVIEGVLRKDPLQKAPLTNPSASVPPTPLYEMYVRGVHLLLSVYHSLYDIVELHPHRVPVVCRSEIQFHLRCGQLERAIATEKHLLGNVLPSVVEMAQQPTVRVFPSNLVSSPHHSDKSGDEKTGHHRHSSNVSGTSQTASSSSPSTTTAGVEKSKLSHPSGTYEEKYNVFKRLNQPPNAAKAALEIVILAVKVAEPHIGPANDIFQQLCSVYGFRDSPEQHFAASLLSAMEQQNDEQVEEVIQDDTCFHFIMASISQIVVGFGRKNPRDAKEKPSSSSVIGTQSDGTFLPTKVDTSSVPHLSLHGSVDHSTSHLGLLKAGLMDGKDHAPSLLSVERRGDTGTLKTSSPFILTVSSSSSSTSFVEQTLPTPPWKGGNENEIDSEPSHRRWSLLQDGQGDLSLPQAGSCATDSCISLDLPHIATSEGPPSVNATYSSNSSPPSHRVISFHPHYLAAPEDAIMTPPPPPESAVQRTYFPTDGHPDSRSPHKSVSKDAHAAIFLDEKSVETKSDVIPNTEQKTAHRSSSTEEGEVVEVPTSSPPVNDSPLPTAEEATLEDLLL